jgi:hypothetical protein
MTVDVTKVATDALVSLAAAAVPVLVAYVRRIALAHMSARELSLLSEIADVAVHAAEEAIGRGNGPAKLDFALQASSELAKHFGVKVSPAQLTDLVHAAVNDARPWTRPQPHTSSVVTQLTNSGDVTGPVTVNHPPASSIDQVFVTPSDGNGEGV